MREEMERVWIANVPQAAEHSGATALNCSMTDRKEAKEKGDGILDSMQENSSI
jgi:hypothetical protein